MFISDSYLISCREVVDKFIVQQFIMAVTAPLQYKIFNDPIHGHIEVHPLCVKIIDTPQFQRLRDLKQIGACYFVYPGASNNRFEHSIGVCHLAGQLVRILQKRQPELNISDKDILCVEIAGLCHDLGHGPFSHLFDAKFIPEAIPGSNWKHEDASEMMFNFLIKDNNLQEEFTKYELDENDQNFIREQIIGPKKDTNGAYTYKAREQEKRFLYEIVANNRNGIDVDKWDYFARDCHGLGIKNTFDHNRYMKFARVIKVDDGSSNSDFQICSRDKEAETLYGMFQLRSVLHRRAYKHRVCNAVEAMIVDALISAEKTEIVPVKDEKRLKLSKCIYDPEGYTKLTDSIFYVILMSADPKLKEAKALLERILNRKLYRCVGDTTPKETPKKENIEVKKFVEDLKDKIITYVLGESKLEKTDLYVDVVLLDYGSKTKNPIENVRFYTKTKQNTAKCLNMENVSLMFPRVFAEYIIRLYYKKEDTGEMQIASEAFEKWCGDNNYGLQSKFPGNTTET
ncbi:deoxynucleoside triphosphate triphosphohydrolase SAMHD1-like [Mytilus galloprovincialis]|uniref:deoxynucleoside triphosphate triphosphohydrolase SAMHD1-like n=1 Tax=Mytilus galloprovincialis TaxID=29158 RepID=UPI003F7BE93E